VWAFVVERAEDGRLLVARRPPRGLLGGLWEFELLPWEERYTAALVDPEAIAAQALGLRLDAIASAALLPPVEHVFTHLRLRLDPLRVVVAGIAGQGAATAEIAGSVREDGRAIDPEHARRAGVLLAYDERRWASRAEIEALPTSVLMDKLLAGYDGARSST
jgi:adenine-specific DNA glycosylase